MPSPNDLKATISEVLNMTDDEIVYYIAIFMAVALTIAVAVLFY